MQEEGINHIFVNFGFDDLLLSKVMRAIEFEPLTKWLADP